MTVPFGDVANAINSAIVDTAEMMTFAKVAFNNGWIKDIAKFQHALSEIGWIIEKDIIPNIVVSPEKEED
jgi:hypothetical protein